MNITAMTMTCTQMGDTWSPMQVTDDGINWDNLAAGQEKEGQLGVKMWLKGVHITASMTVTNADSGTYPELKGNANGYRCGLIQIITKPPVMQARFEGYKYRKWQQRTIPFFDSSGVDESPFYNTTARVDLVANTAAQPELQDYPTTTTGLKFDTINNQRLVELQKSLDFDVYLAVAPISQRYKQAGIRILKRLQWVSETRLTFEWVAADRFKYKAEKFTRAATVVSDVTVADSKLLVAKFPISAEGANEAISQNTLE